LNETKFSGGKFNLRPYKTSPHTTAPNDFKFNLKVKKLFILNIKKYLSPYKPKQFLFKFLI